MIGSVFSAIARFARPITVTDDQGDAVVCRGFVQCADTMAGQGIEHFQVPGVLDGAKYLLLASPEAVAPGRRAETVVCAGVTYEVLGLQPIYCGETLTHWEGVLGQQGVQP